MELGSLVAITETTTTTATTAVSHGTRVAARDAGRPPSSETSGTAEPHRWQNFAPDDSGTPHSEQWPAFARPAAPRSGEFDELMTSE